MKELLIFVFTCYGASNITIFGSIFTKFRESLKIFGTSDYSIYKLFTCMMCLPTWWGFTISAVTLYFGFNTISPYTSVGVDIKPLAIFLDGLFASGCVWLIHTIQEYFEVE